jgi:iron complex outermembrane receptor protein
LDEVIVTAEKHPETLQDVPASVQVVSGENLELQGLHNLTDYAREVPGLAITNGGEPGQGFPVIRGMSTGADSTSLVAIFLNDVPFTMSSSVPGNTSTLLDPDIDDIDHIEVLKGPQSTLYGADAEGGIIKFVTRQPEFDQFSGTVRVDGSAVDGGGQGYALHGSINAPIVQDAVALRAAVFYREHPGFIDNDDNGERNVNRTDVEGGHVALRIQPTDSLETTLEGFAQHLYTPAGNSIFLDPATLKPLDGQLAFSSRLKNSKADDTASFIDTVKWDVDVAKLTNILSYAHVLGTLYSDYSIYATAFGAPAGDGAQFKSMTGSNRWSDEIRLESAPGRFEYFVGTFYTRENDHNP